MSLSLIKTKFFSSICVCAFISLCLLSNAQAQELSRGIQWVRSHDFTIMSSVGTSQTYPQSNFDGQVYKDMNNTVFNSWTYEVPFTFLAENQTAGLPWHQLVYLDYTLASPLTDYRKNILQTSYNNYSGNTGFMVMDEPNRQEMPAIREVSDWLRQVYPDSLVYTNIGPSGGTVAGYYGTTPPPEGYPYEQFVEDSINIMKTDVLMYDQYPFMDDGSLKTNYFWDMAMIRRKALEAEIPYWAWAQTYKDTERHYRTPSESDFRMQVFSHLTAGFTGFSYFTYNDLIGDALVNDDNTLTLLGNSVKVANDEIKKIGQVLRYTTSTDLRYLAGAGNSLPDGTVAWSPNAGGDDKILNIEILNASSSNHNGFVGYFTDDNNEQYFMLTNLNHGAGLSSAETTKGFRITFDETVNSLLWLNPETGRETVVQLDNHILDWNLSGGTGSLFKYDTGSHFAGIPEAPTVHYTFKETSPGTWEVLVEVSGEDTAGLAAYEVWVDGVDPAAVDFEENVLCTVVGEEYTQVGFSPGTFIDGEVAGSYNAGNYQGSGENAIIGVGMAVVDEPGCLPGITPHVNLDVPALLGILRTQPGLTEENFRVMVVGLLNKLGDGFLNANDIVPTLDVIPFILLLGDANGDGVVSAGDYACVQANFGNVGDAWILGDANGDGIVSAGDYACIQANFGNSASSLNTIPEPASLCLFAFTGLVFLGRRGIANN